MKRLAIPPLVALLASQVACSPAPSATNAPVPAAPSTVPRPDASPELPRAIAVLADNPLPGEWSLLRSEGLTIAQFRTDSASDALVAVACMRPSRQVEFLFAPAVRATGRTPGDNRVLTLSVITATERLDLECRRLERRRAV